ncbi:MAG: OmpA family protein, partial [Burkholderiales bacterium]
MKIATRTALTLALLMALAACKPNQDSPANVGDAPEASAAAGTGNDAAPSADKGFDIESVPESTAVLGEFPYITLPAGYSSSGYDTETKDFARFPFWVKGEPQWVEGRMYLATFATEAGKSVSKHEVRKNFEALVQQMGGQKISEEKIP